MRDDVVQLGEQRLAVAEDEVVEEDRRVGMRRALHDPDSVGVGDGRLQREPVDRRAAALGLFRQVAVEGERKGDFAGDDQVVEQRVSVSHGQAVLRYQLTEEFQPVLLAHFPDQREKPFLFFRFHRYPSLPARVEQVPECFRQLPGLHPVRVVGLDENIDARAGPLAMRRDGLGNQLTLIGRADLLQQALAVQELHFRRGIVHDVYFEAAGARLGDCPAQNVVLARAPDVDLDSVAAFEFRDEADQVLLRHGCVQGQRALPPGIGDKARRAIGALVKRRRRGVLRERKVRCDRECTERQVRQPAQPTPG